MVVKTKRPRQWCNSVQRVSTINKVCLFICIHILLRFFFQYRILYIPVAEESFDTDQNFDLSDFLTMQSRNRVIDENSQSAVSEAPKFDYNAVNIKQEPQTHPQSYDDQQYDQSFDMSEMLHYQQPRDAVAEHVEQPPSILPEQFEQHQHLQQQQQQQEELQHQPLPDVAIHDDLAISDSDEDDQDFVEPKVEKNADNDNDEDADGLWF